tara:strand:+ start:275 stop:652 length:378 start_codon:yes stop_codon:yes gene_type:complete
MKSPQKNQSRIKSSIILLIFFLLPLAVQAQDYSQVRRHSNVWTNECKSCHPSYSEIAAQTGIRTEQYFFNFIYEHTNKGGKKFNRILSGQEIQFVARFLLVAAYLHKLETDMRKAGDHLQKNINL